MRIIMIALPMVFVVVSFIIYKKYYKLNGEYLTRIMTILNLRKQENGEMLIVNEEDDNDN